MVKVHPMQQGPPEGQRAKKAQQAAADIPLHYNPDKDVLHVYGKKVDIKSLEPIGSGAFGQVFKVPASEKHGELAIKLMRFRKPKHKDDFKREVEIMYKVNNSGISPTLHSSLHTEKMGIMLMDFKAGQTLGPFHMADREQQLTVCKQVYDCVRTCQREGVFHADLKKENALAVRADGRIECCVIDFGLSQDLSVFDGSAPVKVSSGTMSYMPPGCFKHGGTLKAGPVEGQRSKAICQLRDLYATAIMHLELCLEVDVDQTPLKDAYTEEMLGTELLGQHSESVNPRVYSIRLKQTESALVKKGFSKNFAKRLTGILAAYHLTNWQEELSVEAVNKEFEAALNELQTIQTQKAMNQVKYEQSLKRPGKVLAEFKREFITTSREALEKHLSMQQKLELVTAQYQRLQQAYEAQQKAVDRTYRAIADMLHHFAVEQLELKESAPVCQALKEVGKQSPAKQRQQKVTKQFIARLRTIKSQDEDIQTVRNNLIRSAKLISKKQESDPLSHDELALFISDYSRVLTSLSAGPEAASCSAIAGLLHGYAINALGFSAQSDECQVLAMLKTDYSASSPTVKKVRRRPRRGRKKPPRKAV